MNGALRRWGIRLIGILGVWGWFLVIDLSMFRFGDPWDIMDDVVLGLTLLSVVVSLGAAVLREKVENAPTLRNAVLRLDTERRETLLVGMVVCGGAVSACWWAYASLPSTAVGWNVVLGLGVTICGVTVLGLANRVLANTPDLRSFGVCCSTFYMLVVWFTTDKYRWAVFMGFLVSFPACFYYPNPRRFLLKYNRELFALNLEVALGTFLVPIIPTVEPMAIIVLVGFAVFSVLSGMRVFHSASTTTHKDPYSMIYMCISWTVVLGFVMFSRYSLRGDAAEPLPYKIVIPMLAGVGVVGVAWSTLLQVRSVLEANAIVLITLLGFFSSMRCVVPDRIFNGITAALGLVMVLVCLTNLRNLYATFFFTLVTLSELSATWSTFDSGFVKDDPTRGVMIASCVVFAMGAAASITIIGVKSTFPS